MKLRHLSLDEWKEIAEMAHIICFEESRPKELVTCDYALVVDIDNVPQCFTTIIELDAKCAYMQHGGAFPSALGTIKSFRGYKMMVDYLINAYPRLTTKIKNTNTSMLQMALKVGFIPNGMDAFKDEVFLRLYKDRGEV